MLGTGYYAYKKYLADYVEDPMVREVIKQMVKGPDPLAARQAELERQKQLEEHEAQVADDATRSSVGDLGKLQELVRDAAGAKTIDNFKTQVEACKDDNHKQMNLWNEYKIESFTQAIVAMYAVTLQDTLRRLQVYIVKASLVRQQLAKEGGAGEDIAQLMSMMGGQGGMPAPNTTSSVDLLMEQGAEFLMSSAIASSVGYFAQHGLQSLVQRVRQTVIERLSGTTMRDLLSERQLMEVIEDLRKGVETHAGLVGLFSELFVGAEQHEDLPAILELKLSAATEMMRNHLHKKLFSSPEVKEQHLAKVLTAGTKRLPHVFFKESAIHELNNAEEVSQFFAMIYTSLEAA